MATKSQIKNWVLSVKRKALDSVREEHEKKVKQIKLNLLDTHGISGKLSEMQVYSDKLTNLMDELQLICDESKEVSVSSYYSYGLKDLINKMSDVKKLFIKYSSKFNSSKLVQEDKRYDEKKWLVESNYENVLATVNILSPKKALEYLKGLGFDISSLEEPVKQELAVINVDKRYLFVCGDNK